MEKIFKWYEKNKRTILVVCLVLVFALVFLLNHNTIYAADDYAFYNNVWNNNQEFSFIHIFNKSLSFYLNWTGRFVSTFVNYIFLFLGNNIFNVVNSLVFTIYTYLIYKIVKKENETNPILLMLIFFLVWLLIPQFGEVMLWKIGSVIYLWTMTSVLFVVFLFNKIIKKEDKIRNNIIIYILLFIFSIIAGNGFETNSIMLIVITTLILFYRKFIERKKIPIWSIFSYFGLIIGSFSNFLSPGNAVRMSTMGSNDSLISRILGGLGSFFYRGIVESKLYITISIAIIMYIMYLISKQKKVKDYLKKEVILTFALSLLFVLILISSSIYIICNYTLDNFLSWFYANYILFGIFIAILVSLFILNVILFVIYRKKIFVNIDKEINIQILVFALSAIIGTCAYLMTPNAWPRSYMGMSTFFIITICILIKNIKFKANNIRFIFPSIFVLLIISFVITYIPAFSEILESKKWNDKTVNYIKEQIKDDKSYILVKTYMSKNKYNAASVERWVIPTIIDDPEYKTESGVHKYYEWINIAVTNYYYKDNNAWSNGKRIIGYEK